MVLHRLKWPALVMALALTACSKARPTAAPAPSTAPTAPSSSLPAPLDPRLASSPMSELSFVPVDAEALVRVNLGDVAARSPDPEQSLKAFDFLLRAQQPAAWQVLSTAGISVGKQLATLYLVIGAQATTSPESYLVAGLGGFDEARLVAALKKSGASVEMAGDTSVFLWPRPASGQGTAHGSIGANVPAEVAPSFGDAAVAVGVAPGLLLFGAPRLVRQALAVHTGHGDDIRRGPLARELLAIDATATLWGVALPGEQAYLSGVLPGLERAHFSTVLAAPGAGGGKDLDGIFLLRAEFSSPAQAEAFGAKLRSLLAAADLMTGATPLGATLSEMRKSTKLTLEDDGKTLVASSSL